jgi:hypothetical protein
MRLNSDGVMNEGQEEQRALDVARSDICDF